MRGESGGYFFRGWRLWVVLGVCLPVVGLVIGQYQVNPQMNMGGGGGGSSSAVNGSVRYANQVSQSPGQNAVNNPMLGSQVRYTNVQSGNLGSQIRYSNMAAGPLAPTPVQTPQSASAFAARAAPPPPPAARLQSATPAPPASRAPSSAINGQVGGAAMGGQVNGQVSGSVRY